MDFASSIAVCTLFPVLCTSMHLLNTSDWFLWPFVSFADHFAVSIGEFCNFGSICSILMVLVTFAVVSPSVSMLGASLCPIDVSAGSPQLFGSFAQAFVPMVSGSGSFGSIRCILTISALFSVVSVSFPMVYMSVHVLNVLRWFLGLSISSTWPLSLW